MTNKIFLIPCLMALFLVSACVSSQEFSMLENRIAVLEMQGADQVAKESKSSREIALAVHRVESEFEQDKRASRESYAELKNLFEEIRAENRQLVGRLEESEHALKTMGARTSDGNQTDVNKIDFARLDAAVSRNFQKLVALEAYMGFEPSDVVLDAPPDKAKSVSDTSEKGLYSTAKQMLDQDGFDSARSTFEEFLKRYPKSDNADNARFWIAESYYREKWYEKAILEYQKVIETYATGNKVAAALLKQGYAFSNLGEKANARLILKELIKKYPQSNEARIASEKLKTL